MYIYICEIRDSFLYVNKKLNRLISKERIKKIAKLNLSKDKEISFLSELLLKLIIAKQFRINPKNINFQKTTNGKPYIPYIKDCHFSISHSDNLIVIVVDTQEVGVDAEKINPLQANPLDFFSKTQLDVFNHLSKSSKLLYFYQLWSLKESYIKLLNLTSDMPFNEIDLNLINSITFLYKGYVISVAHKR